jgi:hypothetical protein
VKIATVSGEFAEIKGNNLAIGRGQGSTPKAAIARAIGDLLKQPNVRRKRISSFKATITITNKEEKVVL